MTSGIEISTEGHTLPVCSVTVVIECSGVSGTMARAHRRTCILKIAVKSTYIIENS